MFLRLLMILVVSTQCFAADMVFRGLVHVEKSHLTSILEKHSLTSTKDIDAAVKDLLKTGWFEKIDTQQDGDKVTFVFSEYPIVSGFAISTSVSGASKEVLKTSLESEGIKRGDIFRPEALENWRYGLVKQFASMGHRVDISVEQQRSPSQNTIYLDINMTEKTPIKLQVIEILGEPVISYGDSLTVMDIQPSGFMTWFTGKDSFSDQKINLARQQLIMAYRKQGYFDVEVKTQIAPIDDDNISLKITVTPRKRYSIDKVIYQGLPKDYKADYEKLVNKPYDHTQVEAINESIKKKWSGKGKKNPFVMADIADLHDGKVNLKVVAYLKSNPIVRKVIYQGQLTDEMALRRMSMIREGDYLNDQLLEQTKKNIMGNSFIESVTIDVRPIEGTQDQVDIVIATKENNRHTQLSGNLSYTTGGYGVSATVAMDNKNWLNTGNALSVSATIGEVEQNINVRLIEPGNVYEPSTSLGMSLSRTNTNQLKSSSYKMDQGHVSYGYAWMLNSFNNINTSVKLAVMDIDNYQNSTSVVKSFIEKYGQSLQQLNWHIGWDYSSLDRVIRSTAGTRLKLSGTAALPVMNKFLEYYKIDLSWSHYYKLFDMYRQPVVFRSHAMVGIGRGYGKYSGDLPFFQRYYAGGVGSVRGYMDNALGPKESGRSTGGNKFVAMGVDLILPSPKPDMITPSLFIDMGNVYIDQIKLRDMRGSYGISADFWLPVGALTMSYSRTFNSPSGEKERSNFLIGIGQSL